MLIDKANPLSKAIRTFVELFKNVQPHFDKLWAQSPIVTACYQRDTKVCHKVVDSKCTYLNTRKVVRFSGSGSFEGWLSMQNANDDDFIIRPGKNSAQANGETRESPERTLDPLRSLMGAILLRMIEDYRAGGRKRIDAICYMYGAEHYSEDHIFSFENICDSLCLDPEAIRQRIELFSGKIRLRRRVS